MAFLALELATPHLEQIGRQKSLRNGTPSGVSLKSMDGKLYLRSSHVNDTRYIRQPNSKRWIVAVASNTLTNSESAGAAFAQKKSPALRRGLPLHALSYSPELAS